MKQLKAITEFLTELNLVAAEDLDGWVQSIDKITRVAASQGVGGMTLFRHSYTAVLSLENFNHKRHDPELLMAQVVAWLIEHDEDRWDDEEAALAMDVDIFDAESCLVEFTIGFSEEVGIVPDAGGPISLWGKRWRLGAPDIWYAVTGDIAEPVDAVYELEEAI